MCSSADRGSHNAAFFALRSCHQVLHGDSGEFFSPDYLCSNPPLWCNWTIQVPPGKRIHLHLEDLGPDDSCQGRRDQIHVDEPESTLSRHGVLQKCWREAKYTSSSNTVHVVLLIEGSPVAPYRGFYGRYQAFGPPLVYNPQETDSGFSEYSPNEPSAVTSEPAYDYYDEPEETISATNDEPNVEHEVSKYLLFFIQQSFEGAFKIKQSSFVGIRRVKSVQSVEQMSPSLCFVTNEGYKSPKTSVKCSRCPFKLQKQPACYRENQKSHL